MPEHKDFLGNRIVRGDMVLTPDLTDRALHMMEVVDFKPIGHVVLKRPGAKGFGRVEKPSSRVVKAIYLGK